MNWQTVVPTDAATFWQAAGAIATFAAVLVALGLPLAMRQSRARQVRLAIIRELKHNRHVLFHAWHEMDHLVAFGQLSNDDLRNMVLENSLKGLSTTTWDTLRFELPEAQASCMEEGYFAVADFRSPCPRAIGDEAMVHAHLAAAQIGVQRIDRLFETCKFFRNS